MFWWIAAGLIVFGLVLLGLAVFAVARRVPPLLAAQARAQALQAQAETARQAVDDLRGRLAEVAEHAGGVQERISTGTGRGRAG